LNFNLKVHALVDLDTFYDVYRPLLGGFHPEPLRLMGVTEEGVRRLGLGDKLAPPAVAGGGGGGVGMLGKGPSAGQSTMMVLFDLFLGVRHQGAAREFQQEMLQYMPGHFRQSVLDLRAALPPGGVRASLVARRAALTSTPPSSSASFETEHAALRRLEGGYGKCVAALASFRAYHLSVATKYLVRTQVGTGTSTFRDMLSEAIDGTRAGGLVCPMGAGGAAAGGGGGVCPADGAVADSEQCTSSG
jgi:hypothetical protein